MADLQTKLVEILDDEIKGIHPIVLSKPSGPEIVSLPYHYHKGDTPSLPTDLADRLIKLGLAKEQAEDNPTVG